MKQFIAVVTLFWWASSPLLAQEYQGEPYQDDYHRLPDVVLIGDDKAAELLTLTDGRDRIIGVRDGRLVVIVPDSKTSTNLVPHGQVVFDDPPDNCEVSSDTVCCLNPTLDFPTQWMFTDHGWIDVKRNCSGLAGRFTQKVPAIRGISPELSDFLVKVTGVGTPLVVWTESGQAEPIILPIPKRMTMNLSGVPSHGGLTKLISLSEEGGRVILDRAHSLAQAQVCRDSLGSLACTANGQSSYIKCRRKTSGSRAGKWWEKTDCDDDANDDWWGPYGSCNCTG